MKNKKGFTLWFTGLPSSGKSTLADAVADELKKQGVLAERLDGDLFRQTISKDLGFSPEDIQKNNERVAFVAQLLTKNGVAVVASFASPYRQDREKAREQIKDFVEVYVKCPLTECIKRDSRGNYKKALAGEIPNFIGISQSYETPVNPEIVVETDKESVAESTEKIIAALKKLDYLS
ncbi:MAG: adenylyl-sulfate kinase [Candidatus Nealsonbacteria bacterium CG09_land_8_20_14_0_10_42_14]|uniref:Adenylyl-sulfate kinase n=1 Tax=Candidatus Nealsonbacteria bacterium CG09_land_8_20_14_0_10_42_14 TaxID=1974707 RepID=A0A2H0WX95_9BACT|nr:MAG: adenylyl-sulfate kinase [Candidatus Nealsonbacteria bacterium CG09_land_8_20_14_0_10_42_14]